MLSPGERVRLIGEISGLLSSREMDDVQLVLSQFGFPPPDWDLLMLSPSQSLKSFYRGYVQQGPDDSLLHLARYLGSPEVDVPGDDAGLWRTGALRLFLSHASQHMALVSEVKRHLASYPVDSFVAHEDIEPTKEWQEEILRALKSCDVLVAFLHPEFHLSKWTDQEVGYAIRREVPIVPLRFGVDPYGFMGRFQGLQCDGRPAAAVAGNLVDVLLGHGVTGPRLSEGLVAAFESSPSPEEAMRAFELLKRTPHLYPDQLERIEAASLRNGHVQDAFRWVPELVADLVRRHRGQS